MVIAVPATLPDSTMLPDAVARKFRATSLHGMAGLGEEDSTATLCYPNCPVAQPPDTQTEDDSGGTDWAAIVASLTKAGVDVAKLALVQPGTTLTASGNVSRQNPGYAIPQTGIGAAAASQNIGGLGSSTMLVIGVGLAAVLLMSMNKGR